MDLNGLIWTKNVKPIDGERWAYESISTIYPDLKIFALHWRNLKNRDEINANTPQQDQLVILIQRSKVTHIVKILDKQFSRDKYAGDEFNIYRLVQVVWMADNWDIPPHTDKVFGCAIRFPPNGKVIKLDHLRKFQTHWKKEGLTFQQHVQKVLNIH
ncbi:hypothetical protein JYQ62_30575 [Nostoc sp. UHCC 0702]|nr:hypothetical protein JYQ62_30575 [Nostoc sp. UHCC 0702]